MMLPILTKIEIVIDFKINQDFIAEMLCINREKPMTMCKGTCYLTDQLNKAEEQEGQRAPASKKERVELIYCYSESIIDSLSIPDIYTGELNPVSVDTWYPSAFVHDIFHPPQFILT